jgi:hypothetical protein
MKKAPFLVTVGLVSLGAFAWATVDSLKGETTAGRATALREVTSSLPLQPDRTRRRVGLDIADASCQRWLRGLDGVVM